MNIWGVSLILSLGIINACLLLFQLTSGLHWIPVRTTIHRKTGIVLCITAFVHAVLAILTGG